MTGIGSGVYWIANALWKLANILLIIAIGMALMPNTTAIVPRMSRWKDLSKPPQEVVTRCISFLRFKVPVM